MSSLENLFVTTESPMLTDDRYVNLSGSLLANMYNLRRLYLEQCDLKDLPGNSFRALINLRYLEIRTSLNTSHINLDVVPRLNWLALGNSSSHLPSFRTLTSDIRIVEIKLNSASDLQTLRNFQHNKLQVLDVQFNKFVLDDLNAWLAGFPSVRVLKMENSSSSLSKLKSIDLSRLTGLEYLFLNRNQMESLSCDWKALVNLKKLLLASNRLNLNNPNMFTGLESLTHLDLSHNNIACIHLEAFYGLNNLQVLDLSNNSLTRLDREVFSRVPRLKHLDLSWNRLKIVPETFDHLAHLKSLIIKDNNLSHLQYGVFSRLGECELLDLSWNFIPIVTLNMFRGLRKLKCLVLNRNRLKHIAHDAFALLSSLEKIQLDGNYLDQEYLDFIRTRFPKIEII